MYKKIAVFLSSFALLIFFPLSAYANGNLTVDSATYDGSDLVLNTDSGAWSGTPDLSACFIYLKDNTETTVWSGLGSSCSLSSSTFPVGAGIITGTYHVTYSDNSGTPRDSNDFSITAPAGGGGGGGGAAITIDPTDAANLNAAVGSIPTAAKDEVFSIFPVVMPYILLIITLGVAFYLVKLLMRKAH